MEANDAKICPTHNQFQSFTCFSCKAFLCPTCLPTHIGHKNLVRSEVIGHFLTYYDDTSRSSGNHELLVWTYAVPEKKLVTKSLQVLMFDQESILIQYVIYIMGGLTFMNSGTVAQSFAELYSYDIRTNGALVTLKPMLTKACANALCTTNDIMVYTVGGKNEGGYLNVCEKYSIKDNTWISLKPISAPRANVSLGVLDCTFIYAIGGYNGTFFDTIECLDTKNDTDPWTTIAVTAVLNAGRKFNPRNSMAVVQNPFTSDLLIFGGCSALGITSDTYVFNLKEKKITLESLKLQKSAVFLQRRPILYKDCYYLFEYGRSAGLYVYSLAKKTLERIEPETYLGDMVQKKIMHG